MGRYTDITKAKNRIHSVGLSQKAEFIFREITKTRKNKKWFSVYVTKKLVDDFGEQFDQDLILWEIHELEWKQARIGELLKEKAISLKELGGVNNV